MGGGTWAEVLAVPQGVLHQLTDVLVCDPIEHLGAAAPGRDQASHAELRKVLGHLTVAPAHSLGQMVHRQLSIGQCAQKLDPGGVGEKPEDLHRKSDPLVLFFIHVHTCILT